MNIQSCPICGGPLNASTTKHYASCQNCGHQVLVSGQRQTIIVNDELNFQKISKADSNVLAQLNCLKQVGGGTDVLLDVGCGSGKFLHHSRGKFKEVIGLEISDESVKFATETLGLRIEKEPPKNLDGQLSVVTFWHSLEHIPTDIMRNILEGISGLCGSDSRVIVSVPNVDSLQFYLFKEGYAYYDVPNHLHQFSVKSLDLLMKKSGFEYISKHKMPVYDLFGYIQGWLNLFILPANFLYYVLKRNYGSNEFSKLKKCKMVMSVLLSGIFLPLSILLTLQDYFRPDQAGVITRCYRKT